MSFAQYKPYITVAKRQSSIKNAQNKAQKTGKSYSPIEAYKGAIVKTFWGKAWSNNLEQYSDYESRLPRGRSYLRNGSVIDLQIKPGEVTAKVMGSKLYNVKVGIKELPATKWTSICKECSSSVATLIELLNGELSDAVMQSICMPETGLFPSPKEIEFSCSCPDWAYLCKHVAAVLYGIGARLDNQPELLFTLRQVDANDMLVEASMPHASSEKALKSNKILRGLELAELFELDMVELGDKKIITEISKTPNNKAKKSTKK
jgi:uncharacterized Zn finger protein